MSALETFPILRVAELDRSTAFYCGLLGGEVDYRFPPEGSCSS